MSLPVLVLVLFLPHSYLRQELKLEALLPFFKGFFCYVQAFCIFLVRKRAEKRKRVSLKRSHHSHPTQNSGVGAFPEFRERVVLCMNYRQKMSGVAIHQT